MIDFSGAGTQHRTQRTVTRTPGYNPDRTVTRTPGYNPDRTANGAMTGAPGARLPGQEAVEEGTDCILSYHAGNDDMGRSTTERVKEFDDILKKCGFSTWLHTGDEGDEIKNVIDSARVFVIFVTRRYMDRTKGEGYKQDFNYAMSKMGSVSSRRCVPVIMEPSMLVSTQWEGPLRSLRHQKPVAKIASCDSLQEEVKQLTEAILNWIPPDRAYVHANHK